jgi:NADPH:quinone reductase-like Zn-dependent oxidoreductase
MSIRALSLSLLSAFLGALSLPAAEPAPRAAVLTGNSLQVQTIAVREPGEGEVLIRVRAAGVNASDWRSPGTAVTAARSAMLQGADGSVGLAVPVNGPAVPGFDAAGVVAAIGPGVSAFRPGDEVIAFSAREGAYGTHLVVSAASVAPKPRNITFEEAAAVPTKAVVAWTLLMDVAEVSGGQRVLVLLGDGPLGYQAVQLARARGAAVTAMGPARTRSYLFAVGATEFVDSAGGAFESELEAFDIVFNAAGPALTARAIRTTKRDGIVLVAETPDAASIAAASAAGVRLGAWPETGTSAGQILRQFVGMIDRNQVDVNIERIFPLAEVNEAWAFARQPGTRGHVVIEMP